MPVVLPPPEPPTVLPAPPVGAAVPPVAALPPVGPLPPLAALPPVDEAPPIGLAPPVEVEVPLVEAAVPPVEAAVPPVLSTVDAPPTARTPVEPPTPIVPPEPTVGPPLPLQEIVQPQATRISNDVRDDPDNFIVSCLSESLALVESSVLVGCAGRSPRARWVKDSILFGNTMFY